MFLLGATLLALVVPGKSEVIAAVPPFDRSVHVIIPAGRCRAEIDGKSVELPNLVPLARRWSRTGRPVRIIPDPKATSTCVDRVEAALTRGAVKRGFADEELPEPENSK